MVKPKAEVIEQFNDGVNMDAEELEQWVEGDKAKNAGTGVGLESGRKIADILKRNPDKDPEGYEDEDIGHMRKVTGYIARHLAQEDHLKETKTRNELENAKSTISLKNWGHDPVKAMDEDENRKIEARGVVHEPEHSSDDEGSGDSVGESQEAPCAKNRGTKRSNPDSSKGACPASPVAQEPLDTGSQKNEGSQSGDKTDNSDADVATPPRKRARTVKRHNDDS